MPRYAWLLPILLPVSLFLCSATEAVVWGQESPLADFPHLEAQGDWPWWRGPWRNGRAADDAQVPVRFGESQNVRWKTPVPGRGHASPVVVGQRIFLSTADEARQLHSVLAYHRQTGEQLWQVQISQGGFPARNHPKNTEATPTLASDGQRLIATFFHHEAIHATALDFDGQVLWQKNLGKFNPRKYEYGYAPSPVLYGNAVIVAAEYDGDSFLVALDRTNGSQLWRVARPQNISFSSPVVAHVAGRDQLLISGGDRITSYDPQTGRVLWTGQGASTATCGTVVWEGDLVFASGGFPDAETVAIRADGSGQVVWSNNKKCYEQSMLATGGYLYALTDNGILFCWRQSDGREMWSERLRGPVSASPVLAGGHIYWANERGTMYVLRPNPQRFELVAENKLGDESFASPAVSGNELLLRVAHGRADSLQEWLYCLASTPTAQSQP